MIDFFELLIKTGLLILFCGLFGFGILISIKPRSVLLLFLFGSLFLVCLIAISSLILSILIDDNTLLQINATLIAGALILLTITSFVSKTSHKPIIIKGNFAITPYQVGGGAIVAFSVSAISVFLQDIDLAKILDVIGFIWLIVTGFIITAKEQFDQKGNNST